MVSVFDVEQFLREHLDAGSRDVEPIGAGAWSQCFGFRTIDRDLVVRFGAHVEDFEKDAKASEFDCAALPIPAVLEIGQALGSHFAISERVRGHPLESCSAAQWRGVLPSLIDAMESMREIAVSDTDGWGVWDGRGHARYAGWREFLLSVGDDSPLHRTHGWSQRLRNSPGGDAAFRWGYELLAEIAADNAPHNLVHCDLINRNVHVLDDKISGIFDWGCAMYGDHLYELALFEFWAPWHRELDIVSLHELVDQRWIAAGYATTERQERRLACLLHIGLQHLAYNAYLEDWTTLAQVEARMRVLVGERGSDIAHRLLR